jgi:hypothetical protein
VSTLQESSTLTLYEGALEFAVDLPLEHREELEKNREVRTVLKRYHDSFVNRFGRDHVRAEAVLGKRVDRLRREKSQVIKLH